ncbi:MAG: DUF1501 domain-containing protein [Actinobacteria bacterium]|nr:DUF1501 domain-containing protein [Actinomycetota bacterium]
MSCNDCNRTDLVRRAIAEAGRGLPELEPGMPLPAGTGMSRRSFLLGASGVALSVFGGAALSPRAIEEALAAAPAAQPVLLSVFLAGGVDTLSLLFPAGDPLYTKYRPSLKLDPTGATAFAPDPRLYWHPSAASLATLFGEGKVAALPAVGYDHPDQSHFTSRHYWEVGATDPQLRTGWLGRWLDTVGSADNPLQGLSLDTTLGPSLATATMPVAALDSPTRYSFSDSRYGVFPLEVQMLEALGALASPKTLSADPGLAQAARAARQSQQIRAQLATFQQLGTKVPYPASNDPFPQRLAGLAAMLQAGLPVRVVSITAPGAYDTHAGQAQPLSTGLKLTMDSLLAFQRDLEQRGLADRVLVHVWSEFGRRAQENGSAGTDHGAAGAGFLIGTRVNGGMIGQYPGLQSGLDQQGNLVATADFRGLYAALIAQWLGGDPAKVIPGASSFQQPTLLR